MEDRASMRIGAVAGLHLNGTEELSEMSEHRFEVVRSLYAAFARGDREAVDNVLADDLVFSSPVDVGLDRAGYFERCWPGAGQGQEFEFVRQVQSGDEVIVTYEMKRPGAPKGRNTEILTFDGERVSRVEVYFGWSVAARG